MPIAFQNHRCLTLLLALLGVCVPWTALRAVTLNPQEQAIANYLTSNPGQQRAFLQLDPILTQVARARAADMANRRYFDHVDPNGIGPNYKVQQAGYQLPAGWTNPVSLNYIESIAAGESSAKATWDDWMGSAPHRTHLLGQNAGFASETSYGVGYAAVSGSPYAYYWVVITAPPNAAAPAITINSPSANAHLSDAQVTVSGATSGTTAPQSVQLRVENASGNGDYQTATGTANWSAVVTGLVPGTNTIRAVSLGSGGTVLAQTTRTVIYVVPAPLTVTVSGDGAVTNGFLGTTQRDEGMRYTIKATPGAASLFAGWSGSVTSTSPSISFTMVPGFTLNASFIPNPFLTGRGSYRGELQGGAAGLVKVSVSGSGVFSARIYLGNDVFSAQGHLGADGTATVNIRRSGKSPLTLTLNLDVAGTNGLTGTLSDGASTESFAGEQAYQASNGRFAQAGRYTVSLPANSQNTDSNVPAGDGYATLRIDGAGRATLAGALADGRTFSASGVASTGGTASAGPTIAFYRSIYGGLGSISGKVTLEETSVSDLDGIFRWIKPERPADHVAPHAFDTTVPVVGSAYNVHGPLLSVASEQDNSQLLLGAGNLNAPIVQTGTLSADRLSFADPALQGLSVKFNVASGLFSGSFIHPVTGAKSIIHGVVFQKQNAGYGYFLGVDASGYASVAPAQ